MATAKRLRERAAEAQAACDATLHMEELEANWQTIEIVLGKCVVYAYAWYVCMCGIAYGGVGS